jgi:hypothetical protein
MLDVSRETKSAGVVTTPALFVLASLMAHSCQPYDAMPAFCSIVMLDFHQVND